MHAGESRQSDGRVPRLRPGCDPARLVQSPAEGFLLSRIDGATPWSVLRQIGGLPPEEVDRCLERWVDRGAVVLGANGGGPESAAAEPSREEADAAEIDATLEISVELQRRILDFERRLDRPYHEILGVARDADNRALKRAYFGLSKEFHPDRYFRREIGAYRVRLDRIFRRIVEAHELLSDPTTRAELERSLPPEAEVPEEAEAPKDEAAAEDRPQRPRRSARRLRLDHLRRQFKIPERVLAERRFKARQFYDAAVVASHKERWLEAAASIRLAIAFDPFREEYRDVFAGIQAEVHQLRAQELLEKADASHAGHAESEALRLCEEALHYRPHDPRANDRAARLALELGELEKAREYAERACELCPDEAAYHRSLARVLRREGLRERAAAALEEARRLAPDDPETLAELETLRRLRRRS